MSKMLKIAELFAGTGAFSLAFESTGHAMSIYANDIEKMAKKIYDLNFNIPLTLKDINEVDSNEIPTMDILIAGFPCQPFSIAGHKKGFDDARSNVFWKMLEIIRVHKPKCIVMENVKNLLTHDAGKSIQTIEANIKELGYSFDYKILNTCMYTNIPQNRERLYMVCFSDPEIQMQWPTPINHTIELSHYLQTEVPASFYYNESSPIWNKLSTAIVNDIYTNTIYQYRRYYVRENKTNVCPTLTANMGTGGHNVPILKDSKGIRKLTPKECFHLQGFPDTYILPDISNGALYKLAGNAVCVPLVKILADSICKILIQS